MGDGVSKMGYDAWRREDDALSTPNDSDSDRGSEENFAANASPAPSDTVIIFDWDDTLLCSSAITTQRWTPLQLRQLETVVESTLETAMQLGETMIVTNGNATWVQDSTKRFFPNLQPTLDKMTVLSARASQEKAFPGDPFSWKREAFREIFERRQASNPGGDVNLLVLGDSLAEIQAARGAMKILGAGSVLKTVKFKEAPTVDELLGQLRRVQRDLPAIAAQSRSVARDLAKRQPGAPAHLSSWASGWRFAEAEDRRASVEGLSWLLQALA